MPSTGFTGFNSTLVLQAGTGEEAVVVTVVAKEVQPPKSSRNFASGMNIGDRTKFIVPAEKVHDNLSFDIYMTDAVDYETIYNWYDNGTPVFCTQTDPMFGASMIAIDHTREFSSFVADIAPAKTTNIDLIMSNIAFAVNGDITESFDASGE